MGIKRYLIFISLLLLLLIVADISSSNSFEPTAPLWNNSTLANRNSDGNLFLAYVLYLDELILRGLPPDKEIAYQTIKLKLRKRLKQAPINLKEKIKSGEKEES